MDGDSRAMLRSALSLMTSTVLTAALGVAFWALAARSVGPETLGRDSALIAALVSLSALAQLNGVAAATRFLPRLGAASAAALARGYVAICAASLVVGGLFVVAAPSIASALEIVAAAGVATLFVGGLVLWSIFAVQDAALAAVRRAPWVPVENAVYAVLKIAALGVVVATGFRAPVLAAWVLPLLLVVPAITWLLFARAIPRHVALQPAAGPRTTDGFGSRRLSAFLAQDYAANALYQLSLTALPLLVVALVGARENAWFAVAFSIVSGLALLSHNAVTALVVEGAFQRESLGRLVPSLVRRLLVPLAAGSLAVALVAPLLLLPFGSAYVANSDSVLRLLAVANAFRVAVVLYEALCRLEGDGRRILVVNSGQLVLLVALTVTVAPGLGADGVALAWLVTNAAVAMCCARPLWRAMRGLPRVVPATA